MDECKPLDSGSLFAAPLLGQMLRRLPQQMAPLLPEVGRCRLTLRNPS